MRQKEEISTGRLSKDEGETLREVDRFDENSELDSSSVAASELMRGIVEIHHRMKCAFGSIVCHFVSWKKRFVGEWRRTLPIG